MRRCNADHTRIRRYTIYDQPVRIHRYRRNLRTNSQEGSAHRCVPGILYGNGRLSRSHEYFRQQVECLLRPRCYDHVIGIAGNRPRKRNMVGDCLAQQRAPFRLNIGGRNLCQRAQGAS